MTGLSILHALSDCERTWFFITVVLFLSLFLQVPRSASDNIRVLPSLLTLEMVMVSRIRLLNCAKTTEVLLLGLALNRSSVVDT